MEEGDFVEIEYVGRIASTNEIFDLTSEELAKKEGIYDVTHKYGPVLIIIGAGMVIPGVEKELKKMKPGEEKEFIVKPEEGFGKRKPELIRILAISKFISNNINPVPGTFVSIDGRQAKIQSVTGGRVRVDFNHPLAGKELRYWVKILRHVTDTKEKLEGILKYHRINYEKVEIENEKAVIIGKIPKNTENFLKEFIQKWIKEVKEVEFEESVSNNSTNTTQE